MASDMLPREIPGLRERLHSRFQGGLIADIQEPDVETKVATFIRKPKKWELICRMMLPGLLRAA